MKPVIQPLGVGELKVTKTKLARYEAGEVAHIENVLAHERRGRKHRRLTQVEEIFTVAEERETENTRDLQSTERFELQSECASTIRSETSMNAGLSLSASYGATVSLTATAGFASSEAKEESERNSTKYAKEITEKTITRLLERARTESRTRNFDEIEETNEHGFDNDSGDNVTGVYRWVDKYYRAKVVNYGKRLMYEFIVPEPAAYYLWATKRNLSTEMPIRPVAPVVPGSTTPLTPNAISRTNYLALTMQYDAEGIEPPPMAFVMASKLISRELPPDRQWAFTNEDLDVPRGYQAVSGNWRWSGMAPSDSTAIVLIGQNWIDLLSTGPRVPLSFFGYMGRIGIGAIGGQVFNLALSVEVLCALTPEYFTRWQLATYRAVMTGYTKALLDYEARLAARQIQSAGKVGGENPLLNRETELEQFKWLCLALWADVPFGTPPGMYEIGFHGPAPHGPNATANATKIEFFEESFEWRNATYELYPYFWGNDHTREDRLAQESTDPLFERFLRAGAARIVVPVRPSRTEAVLWYQLTGGIWSGGPIPALTSTGSPEALLYNSYLDDMREVEDVEDIDAEVEISPDEPGSWPIRVPTSLVWLQGDGDLPDFETP